MRTADVSRSGRTTAVGPVTDSAATISPSGPKIGAPMQLTPALPSSWSNA